MKLTIAQSAWMKSNPAYEIVGPPRPDVQFEEWGMLTPEGVYTRMDNKPKKPIIGGTALVGIRKRVGVIVEYKPNPRYVQEIITDLDRANSEVEPQQFAIVISSYIAAITVMLRTQNEDLGVRAIFEAVIADASKKYDEAKSRYEARKN